MREQNFHRAPNAAAKANNCAKVDPVDAQAVDSQAVDSLTDSLHADDAWDALIDPALDRLLARVQAPELRAGFAERVIHSVCPASFQTRKQAYKSFPLRALGLAAALALGMGALLWTNSWTNNSHQTPHSLLSQGAPLPQGASPEAEHLLIAALRSPELSGDDLALVANLREVLEAELIANHPLWLDEK